MWKAIRARASRATARPRPEFGSRNLDLAVVVAVVAVRVVQVAVHQVIDVVAVRHGLVAAARAVLVALVVLAAGVLRRAGRAGRR
jgi:hypothetical protein